MAGFPDFQERYVSCPSGADVFVRWRPTKDDGIFEGKEEKYTQPLPVLVLLHGYPQNSTMFRQFVSELPTQYAVLVPDLPGYGRSTKPIDTTGAARAHSKRAWGEDILQVIDSLCSVNTADAPAPKVVLIGHDRGARLAYRLALDHAERVTGAVLMDIVPTAHMWAAMRLTPPESVDMAGHETVSAHRETHGSHHWIFLASPRPLPETLIAASALFYFTFAFISWTGPATKSSCFPPFLLSSSSVTSRETLETHFTELPEWVKESITPYLETGRAYDRIVAACEDYRAGATDDLAHDLESGIDPNAWSSPSSSSVTSSQRTQRPLFNCPLLILSSYYLRKRFDVNAIWTSLGSAGSVQSYQIGDERTGHFLVNECPDEVGTHVRRWLAEIF